MNDNIIENLVKSIEKYRLNPINCTNYDNYIFKQLKYNCGFMVFGKDVYDKKKNSTICKKLGRTIYKERLYYCEQIPNKTSEHSIIFILFNPSKACPEFRDSTIQNCYNLIKNEKYNYNCMEILNVFSSRNPEVDKKSLKNFDNANNLKFIEKFLENRKHSDVVIGWGYGKENDYSEEINKIKNILRKCKLNLFYIGFDIENKQNIDELGKKQRHPGNQCWSALGGFECATLKETAI